MLTRMLSVARDRKRESVDTSGTTTCRNRELYYINCLGRGNVAVRADGRRQGGEVDKGEPR